MTWKSMELKQNEAKRDKPDETIIITINVRKLNHIESANEYRIQLIG